MADRYIDVREVSEYGRYFWIRSARLVGVSDLGDVGALRGRVLTEVEAVEGERGSTRTQKSDLRTGQSSVADATPALSDRMRRFFYDLKTLPENVPFDGDAFFPGGKLGKLDMLKPADLLDRADEVLHGFTVSANAALPGAADWQRDILAARTTLSDALAGKHQARGGTSSSVSSLATARERFLHVYNGLAKKLVQVVLTDIGRMDEYRSYFLDLQVNEDGSRSTPEAPELPDAPVDEPGNDAGAVP